MKKQLLVLIASLLLISVLFTGCTERSSDKSHENNNAENQGNIVEEKSKDMFKTRTSVWDGSIASKFGGGNGSFSDPYLIKNAAQLAYLSECCKNGITFLGESFRLECDINLNGLEWYPIGQYSLGGGEYTNSKAFQGTFDGNGFVISNFKINIDAIRKKDADIDIGLFGYVNSAYIHNLTVRNFSFYDNGKWPYVGGLIGRAWDNTFVENCHVQNGFMRVTAATTSVGGLIGDIKGNSEYYVANCSADTRIIVECSIYNDRTYTKDGKEYYYGYLSFLVGGLIGKSADVSVYNCFSTGDVSGAMITDANKFNGDFIGGLIGYTSNSNVYSSYSTATVRTYDTEDKGYIGGLIGLAGGKVTTSYSAGKIECSSPEFYCGGLVGGTYDPISNCFSTTDIYADGKNMGCHTLIGVVESKKTNVSNCYISNEAIIDNDNYYYFPKDLNEKVVEFSNFKNKTFICESIGFSSYDKASVSEGEYFSGWIISDNSMPKLFYEDDIRIEIITLDKDLTKYLGITANDLIKKLGYDYSSTGGSVYYPGAKASFILSDYNGMFTGNEKIDNISFTGDRDLGNGIRASTTFEELHNTLGDIIDEPDFMEMDQTYVTSVTVGNIRYTFSWNSDKYDYETCSHVTISKIS